MYSEALAIADRNTVNLMIDELKKQVAEKEAIIQEKDAEIESLHRQLQAQNAK